MAGGWWEQDAVAPQGQQQPGGVFVPDQGALDDARRDQTRTDIAVEGNARDAARYGSDMDARRIEQTDKIAERYNRDPTIVQYRESLGNFAAALRTQPNAAGDNALITAYVKVFDPGSVVNEGEREGVASSQGALAGMVEKAKKDFGMNDAGLFDDRTRQRIRREMIGVMSQRAKGYNQRRAYYGKQAEAFNLDPSLVIGDHDANPFVEQFRSYDKANGLGEYSREAMARAEARQAAENYRPAPDEIALGMDLPGTATTETGLRLTPQQEAAIEAYVKANAGNPNFNEQQYQQFFRSLGIDNLRPTSDPAFYEDVRKGSGFAAGVDYSKVDAERKAALDAELQAQGGLTSTGMDYAKGGDAGFYKGISLNLSDELAGLGGGIDSLLRGGSIAEGYTHERDLERRAQEISREQNGILPEITGGILTPAGIISKGNLARDAAAMGAIAGFGEGEGAVDSLAKTVTGTALGYGGGKVIDAAAPFVVSKAMPIVERVQNAVTKPGQREFVDAAERQGLDYMAADIPGNTGTQMATSVAKMTLGGVPISDRATKIIDAAAERKAEIARSLSPAADVQAGGQAVKRGASEWAASAKDKASKLHEAIPIRPNQPAFTKNTYAALNEINAGLASNRALSGEIADATMQRFQAALENKGLSWSDLKKFRSYVGELAGRPSVSQTMSKADLKKLYAGLSEDMRATASLVGPDAERALARANDYTRGMEQRREEVLTSLLGKNYDKSDEAAFNQIQSWARKDSGDWSKLSRAMRSLPEADANIVRATIIDRLGMAKRGGQDAAGEVFSPSEFMTQWNGLDKRAKAILFQGDQRKALDDLATYFDGLKSASQQFANTSRTGLVMNAVATAGAFGIDLVTGAMASIGQLGAGKFLASPTFAKWMSALVKKPNPAAMLQHVERLTAVARAEPVIANDIFTLQQRLAEQFQKSPGALAAEDTGDGRREPPAQGERNDTQ